jgi:capsular exopolysaccharide synthesis family protein
MESLMPKTSRPDPHLVSLTAPASFAAEQYQGLRLTVERLARTRDARTFAVTSPAAGDGKTVTAINLAGALARGTGLRVLLIDADLRRPTVDRQLGLDAGSGLADALSNDTLDFETMIRKLAPHQLFVLPAGTPRTGAHQILHSPRLEAFIVEARRRFDFVIIDTPPLLPVFDSALLAKHVDGVLMVVAANQTPRKLLGEALNILDPDKVLGIVFNRDERPLFGYYDAYYRGYFPDTTGVPSEA